jgi:hypothetical protein
MKAIVIVGALTVAIALAACGGGSTTAPGPDRPTKAQWIREADPICRSTSKETEPLELEFAGFAAEGRLKMAGRSVRLIIPVLEKNRDRLGHLGMPREGANAVRRFTSQLKRTVGRYHDFAAALEAGNASDAGKIQFQIRQTEKLAVAAGNRVGVGPCGTP